MDGKDGIRWSEAEQVKFLSMEIDSIELRLSSFQTSPDFFYFLTRQVEFRSFCFHTTMYQQKGDDSDWRK